MSLSVLDLFSTGRLPLDGSHSVGGGFVVTAEEQVENAAVNVPEC